MYAAGNYKSNNFQDILLRTLLKSYISGSHTSDTKICAVNRQKMLHC